MLTFYFYSIQLENIYTFTTLCAPPSPLNLSFCLHNLHNKSLKIAFVFFHFCLQTHKVDLKQRQLLLKMYLCRFGAVFQVQFLVYINNFCFWARTFFLLSFWLYTSASTHAHFHLKVAPKFTFTFLFLFYFHFFICFFFAS